MENTIKKKAGRPPKNNVTTTNNTVINDVVKQEIAKSDKPQKVIKQKLVLGDSDELLVKSNVFGTLLYINHKTGDETVWGNEGDIQPMTVRDLKDMKAKQMSFYKENWISIVGSSDVDFAVYSLNDVYEFLQVARYYKDSVVPENLDDVFDWTKDEMKERIPLMPVSIRENIIVRANDKIKDGSLDSISKMKAIEEVLNCELASPED